ncbi:MAG: hypothetical protein FWG87_00620 [Defluviitaleaceae bacterium]|nr:hypothetical protein [Defluviitaleaceae bacterium]
MRLLWGFAGFCRGRIYPSRGINARQFGQATSINAERGNLGTDKSVPYKNLQFPSGLTNDLCNTDLTDFRGFGGFVRGKIYRRLVIYADKIRVNKKPRNLRINGHGNGFCRGRIYPSRDYLALR